jgi:hypothetical protein
MVFDRAMTQCSSWHRCRGHGRGASEGGSNGLQLEIIASVPEPASLTLIGAGSLLTLAVRRNVRGTRAFPG